MPKEHEDENLEDSTARQAEDISMKGVERDTDKEKDKKMTVNDWLMHQVITITIIMIVMLTVEALPRGLQMQIHHTQ
jgi:Fe2+ transport system protein B